MAEKEQGRQEREPGQQPEPTTERGQEELSDEQLDQVAGDGKANIQDISF